MEILWVCDVFKTILKLSQLKYLTDCFIIGVAFTKHLIHLYAYTGSNELAQRIEVRLFLSELTKVAIAI